MDNIQIKLSDPMRQEKVDPIGHRVGWLSTPHVFAAITLLLITSYEWATRWLISGAPILTYSVLLGAAQGNRFLPIVPLWTFFATLNLVYSIAATSWLLYWVFAAGCYPLILLSCLFQFDPVANFVRRRLRALLKELQFTKDKIAYFNLPALEIDTEVDGLMVIRGVTISLSSLTLVAHGIEVAIKLSDDMELAITTDKVTVSFFRKIEIEDVYANLKGGSYEMSFGDVPEDIRDRSSEAPIFSETPLLRAATISARDLATPMVEKPEMTYGAPPEPTSPEAGLKSVKALSPDDDDAIEQYEAALRRISESSLINRSKDKIARNVKDPGTDSNFNLEYSKDMRAAVCSRLHDKASIPHPPPKSIKVTTLQNLSSPSSRKFMHRLPMLLRLLLNPLSYFHPVHISSITAGGSGKWIQHMLQTHVFKHYSESSSDIRRLEARVNTWLSGANFVLQLDGIMGLAHVPFVTTFDIDTRLAIADLIVYRTLPREISLAQVIRLRGADASVAIPAFLLPHHEHLLPPRPTRETEKLKEKEVNKADGLPHAVQAAVELDQTRRDETNINISARGRLPAVFDQQLLDFIAALVKATKFIEMEKSLEEKMADESVTAADAISETELPPSSPRLANLKDSMKAFNKKMNTGMERTMKRGIVGGMANDRWIAKLVGKVTKLLETVRGDVGYSGDLPVPLEPYRRMAETETKLLA